MANLNRTKKKNGYIVISTVLVLLFVTLGISATLSFLSIGSAQVAQGVNQGEQALLSSDACLEEGLLRLKMNVAYSGGDINFPTGICHLGVADDNGIFKIDASFEQQDKFLRSIEAKAQSVDGVLQIISWEEKPFVIK